MDSSMASTICWKRSGGTLSSSFLPLLSLFSGAATAEPLESFSSSLFSVVLGSLGATPLWRLVSEFFPIHHHHQQQQEEEEEEEEEEDR